jgi:hypothetical protein
MDSLVPWKKKRDEYHDEADEDEIGTPRLVDSMQECKFIARDETNAKAMRSMKIKWW